MQPVMKIFIFQKIKVSVMCYTQMTPHIPEEQMLH